jgi:hypothetical protein
MQTIVIVMAVRKRRAVLAVMEVPERRSGGA